MEPVQPFQAWTERSERLPEPRPVARSLSLLADRLAGYTSVQRLTIAPERPPLCPSAPALLFLRSAQDFGSSAQVYACLFTVAGQPVHVLWYDDGVAQLPWEREPEVTVALSVSSPAVTVTHIITRAGQTQPVVEIKPAIGGRVALTVGETPILVEEALLPGRTYLPPVTKEW